MSARALSCLALLLACAWPAQARSALELAAELTTLTELDRAALFGARMAVDDTAQLGYIDHAAASCFAGKSHEPLTAPIARYLARRLTKRELQKAVDFYGSAVGRRLVQQENHAFVDALTPGAEVQAAAPYTPQEQAQIDAFLRTGAGVKLVKRKLMQSAARDPAIAKVMARMRDSCIRVEKHP